MGANTRDIQHRLRSVRNINKITKAMELVASAKMRRAVQAMTAARPYADRAWEMLMNLSRRTDPSVHPLLQVHSEVKKIGLIIVATNRGLVGGFNAQLFNMVNDYVKKIDAHKTTEIELITLGNKAKTLHRLIAKPLAAEFTKNDVLVKVVDVQPLSRLILDSYINRKYDRIVIAYMDYISTMTQKPKLRQLLPFDQVAFQDGSYGLFDKEDRAAMAADEKSDQGFEYLFEPSADEVAEFIFPRLVEMQLYRALLETNAAEQSARMMAMRNASDAATDLIDDLSLTFNQARQAAITKDLTEISAGRAALEA